MRQELYKERKNGLFTTAPLFGKDDINFEQKEDDFFDAIDEILGENIKVVRDVPKILGNKAFDDCLKKILPEENESVNSLCSDIHKIITCSNNFQTMKTDIIAKISSDF